MVNYTENYTGPSNNLQLYGPKCKYILFDIIIYYMLAIIIYTNYIRL